MEKPAPNFNVDMKLGLYIPSRFFLAYSTPPPTALNKTNGTPTSTAGRRRSSSRRHSRSGGQATLRNEQD